VNRKKKKEERSGVFYALGVSGAMNAALLALVFYWSFSEKHPRTLCRNKPRQEQKEVVLSHEDPGLAFLHKCRQLPFTHLVNFLSLKERAGNGYQKRELALACLKKDHFFDVERALAVKDGSVMVRNVKFHGDHSHEHTYTLYPDLDDGQYEKLVAFARTESWPQNAEGLYRIIKEQSNTEPTLLDAFYLTEEFHRIEKLISRKGQRIGKKMLLQMLLEGEWDDLKMFCGGDRQKLDLSEENRREILTSYLAGGSVTAIKLLARTDEDYAACLFNGPSKGSEMITPEQKETLYVIQNGDSLWKIAKKYQTSVSAIKQTNELTSDILRPGKILVIP